MKSGDIQRPLHEHPIHDPKISQVSGRKNTGFDMNRRRSHQRSVSRQLPQGIAEWGLLNRPACSACKCRSRAVGEMCVPARYLAIGGSPTKAGGQGRRRSVDLRRLRRRSTDTDRCDQELHRAETGPTGGQGQPIRGAGGLTSRRLRSPFGLARSSRPSRCSCPPWGGRT